MDEAKRLVNEAMSIRNECDTNLLECMLTGEMDFGRVEKVVDSTMYHFTGKLDDLGLSPAEAVAAAKIFELEAERTVFKMVSKMQIDLLEEEITGVDE